MRRRRHEMLAAQQQESPEAIVIVDSSKDQLLEQVGVALDALRLAGIVRQTFPSLREQHAAWEIARAILAAEEEMRITLIDAVKAHGAGNHVVYETARTEIGRRVAAAAPTWIAT